MKEIVVISGKGGTGKTSVAASFAASANDRAVMVDCDVDAADLHLILYPRILDTHPFHSGHKAVILQEKCIGCGNCLSFCRFDAVVKVALPNQNSLYQIDPVSCEGCGVCVRFCPVTAVDFPENQCGEWYESFTRFGPLVHARLGVAAENSGRLVTLLRQKAKEIAESAKADYVIIDGSPGIGCPVIASLTGADAALIVTEPTISGEHDFQRVMELTKKLGVPAMVCVNKWDINPAKTDEILQLAEANGLTCVGNIHYGNAVTEAQCAGQTVIEYGEPCMAGDFGNVWKNTIALLK